MDDLSVELVFDINISTLKFMGMLTEINEFVSFDFSEITFDDDWLYLTVWYNDDVKDDLDDYVSGNRYMYYKNEIKTVENDVMYR